MYWLFVKRLIVKKAVVTKIEEGFGRNKDVKRHLIETTNSISWTCTGPFSRRALAERAAARAMATDTCLSVLVVHSSRLDDLEETQTHAFDFIQTVRLAKSLTPDTMVKIDESTDSE